MRNETAESRRLQAENQRDEGLARNLLALADDPNHYTAAYREAIFRAAARRLAAKE